MFRLAGAKQIKSFAIHLSLDPDFISRLLRRLKPGKDCYLFHWDLRINLINIKNKLIIFVVVTVLKMLLYVGVLVFWDKRN